MTVLLFLLVTLAVSFWQNRTPLSVLKWWFGVKENPVVEVQEVNKTNNDELHQKILESYEKNWNTQTNTQPTGDTQNVETTQPTTDTQDVESTQNNTTTTPRQTEAQQAENFVDSFVIH